MKMARPGVAREWPYICVKVVMGSVQSNHDPLDGLDSNSNDLQCSLHSFLSGCGATDQGKALKRTRSIIVRGSSSRKFGVKHHFICFRKVLTIRTLYDLCTQASFYRS